MATWGGILRWEPGKDKITRYTSEHSLLGNATRKISVDHNGIVWAASHEFGLSYLLTDQEDTWQPIPQLNSWTIRCLLPRPGGGIYIALRDIDGHSALGLLETPLADLKLVLKDNPANKDIDTLVMDSQGVFWIGNAWGLHSFINPGQVYHYDLNGARVRALEVDMNGTLWIGSNRGLYCFQKDNDPNYIQEESWPRDEVHSLAVNPDTSDLWVVTSRETGKISKGLWQNVYDSHPDRLNILLTTRVEGKYITWGGGGEGIFQLGGSKLENAFTWSQEDNFSNAVQCLAVDQNTLWVGTARGLYRYSADSQNWTDYNSEIPGQFCDIRSILVLPGDNRVLIGSWSSGMEFLVQGYYLPDPQLPPAPIVSAVVDENGVIWAASIDTIYWRKNRDRKWEPVPGTIPGKPPNTLNMGIIQVICPQRSGIKQGHSQAVLWIGTSNGLIRYRPGGPVNWDTPREWGAPQILEQASIQALAIDMNNRLWVGTSGGLYCQPAWECCLKTDARALAPTPENTLWVGGAAALEEWALSQTDSKFVGDPKRRFNTYNSGLASNVITALALRENYIDNIREVWIGTPNGLTCYRCPFSGNNEKND